MDKEQLEQIIKSEEFQEGLKRAVEMNIERGHYHCIWVDGVVDSLNYLLRDYFLKPSE